MDLIKRKINKTGDGSSALYLEPDEGFRRVRDERFAFHSEGSSAFPIIARKFQPHEICDTRQIPFRKNLYIGMVVGKSSPFTEKVKRNWAWMRETGIVFKHKLHWVSTRPACVSNAYVTSVGFDYVGSMFTFLVASYAISFIILIGEVVHARSRKTVQVKRVRFESKRF